MLFIFNGTDPDLSRPMNHSMIVGRESFRYPLRLPKIFWYFGNYRIRQELSFIFFPFGDLFGCSTKAVAGKVQKLQNRAARVLTSASYDSSTDFLLDKLGWKYLKTQRKIAKGTMVYKALNGLAPNYLAQMFTERSRITYYTLRDTSDKLALPQPRTNYMKTTLWNSLPVEARRDIPYLNLRRTAATFFDNFKFFNVYTYVTALMKTRCNVCLLH